jgi:hypothetical protein
MFAESYITSFCFFLFFPFILFLGLFCTFEIGVERRPLVVRADERHEKAADQQLEDPSATAAMVARRRTKMPLFFFSGFAACMRQEQE